MDVQIRKGAGFSALRGVIFGLFTVCYATIVPAYAAVLGAVRTGAHPDFTRLVLDLDEDVSATLQITDTGLVIWLPENTYAGAGLDGTKDPVEVRFHEGKVGVLPRVDVLSAQRLMLVRRFKLPGKNGFGSRLVFDFAPVPVEQRHVLESDIHWQGDTDPHVLPQGADRKIKFEAKARAASVNAALSSESPFVRPSSSESSLPESLPFEPPPPKNPYLPMRPPATGDGDMDFSAVLQSEGRAFPQESADDAGGHFTASFALEATVDARWAGGDQQLIITPFARVDVRDSGRSHVDIREARWMGIFGPLELRLGFDTVFWGVTESVHLVDIINQDDALEDIDQEDKLGQLMANVRYVSDFGTFAFYALPWSRERDFPGRKGRPNGPFDVDRSQTQWQSSHKDTRFSWAARWSDAIGPFDLGISYFTGNARDPRLLPGLNALGMPVLIPYYDVIDQLGFDGQGTFGPLLVKVEATHQWNDVEDFTAVAAGFEYSFFNVFKGTADLSILSEYLYDGRKNNPLAPFEDDLFLGVRWASNDVASTQVLAGAIIDLEGDGTAMTIEMSRRIGQHWSISLDGRFFTNISDFDPLNVLRDDDFVQLRLMRYF